VRPLSLRAANAIAFLDRRSPTFSRLLTRLQGSDLIVHLVEQQGGCDGGVKSCLLILGPGHGYRYVRVLIQSMQPYDALLRQIAHELQHAVDIAGDAQVIDGRTSVAMCNRIGWGTAEHCETRSAQDVSRQVLAEVAAARPTSRRPRRRKTGPSPGSKLSGSRFISGDVL
jgi:hypothetical protein